ncbi:MAG: hypothetical protein ABSH34_29455 [Verrucomicrobiota bacterium]|jgi:REP element-mobilizing transposase RayT
MARALRTERTGGRYHVTARGNERQEIFRDDADHFHSFVSRLGWLPPAPGLGLA